MSLQMYCILCGKCVYQVGYIRHIPVFLYKLKKTNIALLKEVDVSVQFMSYVHFCLWLTLGMINYMAVEIYRPFPA